MARSRISRWGGYSQSSGPTHRNHKVSVREGRKQTRQRRRRNNAERCDAGPVPALRTGNGPQAEDQRRPLESEKGNDPESPLDLLERTPPCWPTWDLRPSEPQGNKYICVSAPSFVTAAEETAVPSQHVTAAMIQALRWENNAFTPPKLLFGTKSTFPTPTPKLLDECLHVPRPLSDQ